MTVLTFVKNARDKSNHKYLVFKKWEFKGLLKISKDEKDTLIECNQINLLFSIIPLVVYTFLPPVVKCLNFIGEEAFILLVTQRSTKDLTS